MKVIYKKPEEKVQLTDIPNTLQALQEAVEGPIECITLQPDKLVAFVNEEGIIWDMKFNCKLLGLPIYGPVVICGVDGEDFADIPEEYADVKLWRVKV